MVYIHVLLKIHTPFQPAQLDPTACMELSTISLHCKNEWVTLTLGWLLQLHDLECTIVKLQPANVSPL